MDSNVCRSLPGAASPPMMVIRMESCKKTRSAAKRGLAKGTDKKQNGGSTNFSHVECFCSNAVTV
eukprot:3150861-Amphidinium_carterae.1